MTTLSIGDRIPSVTLFTMTDDGPGPLSSEELFAGKTVALFGLPGAFTRTCSAKHLPGFVENADALKAKGVDEIICLSVNDAYAMDVWGRGLNVGDAVLMVGDGNLDFTRATGLETDMSAKGFGWRCRRFSMLVVDGVIKTLHLEAPGEYGETSAEVLLGDL